MQSSLERLSSQDGALGPMLLAGESELPLAQLQDATLAHVIGYRNALRELLSGYLDSPSSSSRERTLAAAVLDRLQDGGEPLGVSPGVTVK